MLHVNAQGDISWHHSWTRWRHTERGKSRFTQDGTAVATIGEDKYPHARGEIRQCCIKLIVDQFAIVKTPGFVEPIWLKIVAGVRHLTAVPRITEEKDVVSPQFFRGQTSNARFGDFVENRINRGIDIIWLDGTAHVRPLQNADFRFVADSRFHVAPPSEFWPRSSQFNEQERGADARPNHSQFGP